MQFLPKPIFNIFKYVLPLGFTVFLSFFIFQYHKAQVFAECGDANCICNANPPGTDNDEYCCQGGEMCCTGGGCPSYHCNKSGEDDYKDCAYHAVVKDDKTGWTCKTWCLINGVVKPHTDSSLLYKKRGTCEWCPDSKNKTDQGSCPCNTAPNRPFLVSPLDGANFEDILPIVLDWSDVNWQGACCGSRTYHLQVREVLKTYNEPLVVDLDELGTTSQYNFITPYSENFCWHVRAHNDKGWGNWSDERCFTSQVLSPGAVFTPENDDDFMDINDDYIWNLEKGFVDNIVAQGLDLSAEGVGLNLKEMHVYKRKDPNSDGDFSDGSWQELFLDDSSFQTCNDTSTCWISPPTYGTPMTWRPNRAADEGFWQLHINAFSHDDDGVSARGRCTGNPEWTPASNWWSDCDPNDDDDIVNLTLIGPPFGEMMTPADDPAATPNGAVLNLGSTYTFIAEGTDQGNNLYQMGFYRRPVTGSGNYGDAISMNDPVGYTREDVSSGSSHRISRQWTPTTDDLAKSDTWVIYPNVFDELESEGGKCSGSPTVPDNGTLDDFQDCFSATIQNDPSVCDALCGGSSYSPIDEARYPSPDRHNPLL